MVTAFARGYWRPADFDLAPDGDRVLALMPAARPEEQQTVNHATFMFNVSEEIRRRVMAR